MIAWRLQITDCGACPILFWPSPARQATPNNLLGGLFVKSGIAEVGLPVWKVKRAAYVDEQPFWRTDCPFGLTRMAASDLKRFSYPENP
jgi:hypothetical protein